MNGTIYLTYSGRNCEAVLQVMEAVIRAGCGLMCECMLPSFDDPEGQVRSFIARAAQEGAVAAVITTDALDCPYMARDLRMAVEAGARLIPVVVGNARLPQGFAQLLSEAGICSVSEYPTEEEMAAVMLRIKQSVE